MSGWSIDNNHELVSVIVPVYNVSDYLEKCVNSLVAQTYRNLEIILVDDGSTDGTTQLCDEYAKKYDSVFAFHQQNQGSTAARNLGIEKSKGKYLGFVDSDDWIEPEMFEKLYNAIARSNSDISVCRMCMYRNGVEYPEVKRSVNVGTYYKSDGVVRNNIIYSVDYVMRGISPNLCDKLFERNLLIKSQANVDLRLKFAEDDVCVYSALLDANSVTFIDEVLYHYRQHEASVTKVKDSDYFAKINLFYNQMLKVFERQSEPNLLVDKLNRYMVEFVIRGLNKSFGFNYGNIVPFYRCNIKELYDCNAKKIILYGAGNIGRDYYYYLKDNSNIEVLAWVDNNYAACVDLGLDVKPVDAIRDNTDLDIILLAIENKDVAEAIREILICEYNIENERIIWNRPIKLIESLETIKED